MEVLDGSTLFSRHLFTRKFKVLPQPKCTENYTENVENFTKITNTRPTNLLSLKEQQKSKYFSYEELVYPSKQNSLTLPRRDNMQENTKDNTKDNNNTNVLSSNDSIFLRSEENIIQRQKDISERAELNSLKMAQEDQKGNWIEEIKKLCFNLMEKFNLLKILKKHGIVKDHWKEDSTTNCCSFCHRKFTMFFRRHHCRICGNIYCSTCSSGRTLLDPNVAMPVQFVAAATSNDIKYNRNSRGFEFDGFEYNYLDYEEVDQEQQEQSRQSDREREHWEYQQQQKPRHEFHCELGDQECLYKHDYEREPYQIDQEFDNEFIDDTDDYFVDEYSSSDYSSDSSSFIDFDDNVTDDDSSTVNNDEIEERNKDGIDYGSEPVRGRVCINCHKIFELDENDWCSY